MLKPLIQKYQKSGLILVGHSWGGPLVAQIAMDYGYETDQLVFVAASLFGELEPYEWYRSVFKFSLIRWMIPRTLVASNTELYTSVEQLDAMLPKWKNIRQSTTILQGTNDRLVDPKNGTLAKKHLINTSAELVWIENADHFLPWSHPEYIIRAIDKHLDILNSSVK
ncbi:MAG: alpha/beta hydrolase [Saprospiraceae bacterium]|nr:alpha/beta hydrolase [Saprospiraceae bacterium]